MPTDAPVALSQLNEGCRILTISASVAGANEFVARLKALTHSQSGPPSTSDTVQNIASLGTSKKGPFISEYTISNRYYTAEVHFAAYALQDVYPGLFLLDRGLDYKPPPAVIFVWVDGEPYAKHAEELSRIMATATYDPEVWLAVRIPNAEVSEAKNDDEETHNENTDIDTTLMSLGFEYVDATREAIPTSETDSDNTSIDIPRLPRVLDALSTIMWPSMQSSKSMKMPRTTSSQLSSANIAQRQLERDSIMEELLSVSGISGITRVDTRQPSTNREKESDDDDTDSLFSPYDFNSNSHFEGASPAIPPSSQKPWLAQSDTDATSKVEISDDATGLVSSPTDETSTSSFGLHTGFEQLNTGANQVSIGFDDDFTVFVSAPAELEKTGAGAKTWTPLDLTHAGFQAKDDGDLTPMGTAYPDSVLTGDSLVDRNRGLTPASAQIPFKNTGSRRGRGRGSGPLYRSLGSVSDFGGDDNLEETSGYNALDEDSRTDDEDYGAEWEDGVEETIGADDSWEERTGDWDDLNDDLDGDEDEDMPTKEEILATAARIFGSVPPEGQFRKASEVKREADAKLKSENVQGGEGSGILLDATQAAEHDDIADDEMGPAGPVDIESVLRSLQGLRTEIAGVEDEEARRRMAARVALGFVYGMDLEKLDPGSRDEQ